MTWRAPAVRHACGRRSALRLLLVACLVVGCTPQPTGIERIEAGLAGQGLPPDVAAATDDQLAAATAAQIEAGQGPSDHTALVRAVVAARPSAVEPVLAAVAARARELGFSDRAIGALLTAALQGLRDAGAPADTDALVAVVAAATGLSPSDVVRAATPLASDRLDFQQEMSAAERLSAAEAD